MSSVAQTLSLIASAVDRLGAPAFSKASGVPYTTLVDWQKCGYRPRTVVILEKLAAAAEQSEPPKDKPKAKRKRAA